MMSTKKPNVNVTSQITIDTSALKIWKILAEDFGEIGTWASGVKASKGLNPSLENNLFSERHCEIAATGFNDTKERIITFDKKNYILTYELYHGIPGFVKDAYNTWKLIPGTTSTQVIATTEMRATGILGRLMKGFMTRSTQKVLDAMCRELKHYVETGEPHPDKQKATKKLKRKN